MQLRLTSTTSNGVEACERQFSRWPCARCLPVRRSVSPTRRRAAVERAEPARVPVLEQAALVRELAEPAPRPVMDRAVAQAARAAVLAVPVPDPAVAPTAARTAPRRRVPVEATIPPVADVLPRGVEKRLPSPARQLVSHDGVCRFVWPP